MSAKIRPKKVDDKWSPFEVAVFLSLSNRCLNDKKEFDKVSMKALWDNLVAQQGSPEDCKDKFLQERTLDNLHQKWNNAKVATRYKSVMAVAVETAREIEYDPSSFFSAIEGSTQLTVKRGPDEMTDEAIVAFLQDEFFAKKVKGDVENMKLSDIRMAVEQHFRMKPDALKKHKDWLAHLGRT